ncbi:MAG: SpoIIE family protein phosphatase [Bacteroidota bacterium]
MENVANSDRAAIAPYAYAIAGRPLAGERHSGDAGMVCPTASGVLISVVDGLGHGTEAAAASRLAIQTCREHAGEPVMQIIARCHSALLPTRGAAMVVAAIDCGKQSLSWLGVGNVEAILLAGTPQPSRRITPLTNGSGVVGYRLPPLETRIAAIQPGDRLVFATDGVDERFAYDEIPTGTPYEVAHAILDKHGKTGDDALVLVVHWLGPTLAAATVRS